MSPLLRPDKSAALPLQLCQGKSAPLQPCQRRDAAPPRAREKRCSLADASVERCCSSSTARAREQTLFLCSCANGEMLLLYSTCQGKRAAPPRSRAKAKRPMCTAKGPYFERLSPIVLPSFACSIFPASLSSALLF